VENPAGTADALGNIEAGENRMPLPWLKAREEMAANAIIIQLLDSISL